MKFFFLKKIKKFLFVNINKSMLILVDIIDVYISIGVDL